MVKPVIAQKMLLPIFVLISGIAIVSAVIITGSISLKLAIGAAGLGVGLAGFVLSQAMQTIIERDETLDATRQHLATLARLVRETNERLDQVITAATPDGKPLVIKTEPDSEVRDALLRTLTGDLAQLGKIVAELAETLGDHEDRIVTLDNELRPVVARASEPPKSVAIANAVLGLRLKDNDDETEVAPLREPSVRPETEDLLIGRLREALGQRSEELLLRPVATLPQRKIQLYEASLGMDAGGITIAGESMAAMARRAGLSTVLSARLLERVLVLTRFFRDRNRTTPIIAVLSDADVVATRSFAAFIEVLRSDTELAERIVIGLPAAGALRLGPVEREVLRTFRDTGARVLLSDFDDLSLRPEVLAATGAKFVRLGAGTLAAAGTDSRLPVHHADLAALFGRAGMEMICTDIESEDQLREMADLDIGLAQGTLLGDWRPVRDDLLTAPPATPMQDNAGTKPAAAAPASATAPAAASAAKGESPKLPLRALLRRA